MYRKVFKRLLDIGFALLLLLPILPVVLVCGLVIKLEDRGTVFYNSKRVGKDGKVFTMFKLRTMKMNAPDIRNEDGSTFNSDRDPRQTKVGRLLRKTSLDELPQIFNIIKGDMSFLGPRPDLPEHLHYYEGNESKRLEVLPGISGYNQAYYRNSVEWKQRLQHDVYYVENLSFILDIKILFKTIVGVLISKGIYGVSKKQSSEGVTQSE